MPLALVAQEHKHGGPADLGNVGHVHLATSCNAAAQKEIDLADALLHSFWYGEAETSFRRAADADPQCGMAWWGVAMSNFHQIWAPPTPAELKNGSEAARKAEIIGAKTGRERAYIDAIGIFYADADKRTHPQRLDAYENAMESVAAANPDDHEAAIFYALAIRANVDDRDKTYAKQKKAGAILARILPLEPEHPGIAHYIIHCYDYPSLASLALPAARAYAKLAPGSPHALHMPAHIFTRLGLWDESIASNLASAAKAHEHGLVSDELHAIDYLEYAYLQRGENAKAYELVKRVPEMTKDETFQAAYAVAAVLARYSIERREWKEAAALTVPQNADWTRFPWAEANIHFAVALGAARSNEPELAKKALDRLAAIHQTLVDRNDRYWAGQVEIQRLSAAAWLDRDLKLAQEAAALEASTDKHPVTPGAIVPARELLAEMLLEAGNAQDALTEAQRALRDAPNRYNGLRLAAVAAEKSGRSADAKNYRSQIAELRVSER